MAWFTPALTGAIRAAGQVVPDGLMPSLRPEDLASAARAVLAPASREGLEQLMASIQRESPLSFFGHMALRWDALRLLRNAAQIDAAHAKTPALAAAPVEAPIFILGLPRSGTTFLHTLLAEDPANLVPRNWQTIYPAPRPPGFDPKQDPRARQVDRQLRLFEALSPGFAQMHPITADSPQECSEITAHVFQSLRFDSTHRVPSYFAWLEAHGHEDAFRFHKRFLQYLQNGRPGRWVLKCPDHTFTLEAILRIYPDARFVFVHRDPLAVIASVAHLTEVLRRPFLTRIDQAEIGAQVAERWIYGANLLLAFDQRGDIPPARKFHIHYKDLTHAPLEAIARLYGHFNLPLENTAHAAMARRIGARPQGGYGAHAPYRLESFALNRQELKAQFAPYIKTFCAA
ncbi:sulfotransferase [Acidocella sp.]|uniref:sulfotransferase family protein n=1 Tax=Acidocella sp. TaxID=50710 RepID=UPI0026353862|nr:sulfotransferase [Acidocella sp.]